MNFALPPDNDWEYIAELTGDESWRAENMRTYFTQHENCTYVLPGTAGHGFDGFISVCAHTRVMKHKLTVK